VKGLSLFGQIVFSNNYYSTFKKTRGFSYEELSPLTDSTYTALPIKGNTNPNYSYAQPAGKQWNRYNMVTGAEYSKTLNNGELYASTMYNQEVYTSELVADTVPWAKVNILGRVNYTHAKKYVAEFAYSYSGTDNYKPGNRFGFFPTVSGAWIISNEDFLINNKVISFLKVRASTGLLGNDQIGTLARFMFIESYGSPNGSYRLGNGLATAATTRERLQFGNPNTTWEKAYKTNFGIDAQLFNRLSISADYYFENRKDIFVNPSNYLSVLIGGRYNYANLGTSKNSGIDLELLYNDKIADLNYHVMLRGSYSTSEIVDMKEQPRAYDYLYRKGNPIGQPFVYEAIGYFADADEIASSPFQTFGAVVPGDVKYKDQNGDDLIDENDMKAIGYNWMPNIVGSFEAGIDYRGFDLAVFLQGVTQRTVSIGSMLTPFLTNGRKPSQWVADNYWTPEKGNAALYPRLTTQSNDNNYKNNSTLYQRDGSYLRIKNIEMGYSFNFKKGFGVESLRAYVNAVNPFVFSYIKELDVDPEALSPYSYPVMKSYNIGLTFKF
jgi:TonB-linked SusC/RagA family outer membrane protein